MLTRDPNRARLATERDPAPPQGVEYVRPEEASITNARLELERNKRRLNSMTSADRRRIAMRDMAGFGRRDFFWLVAFVVLLVAFAYTAFHGWRAGSCALEAATALARDADTESPEPTPAAAPRDSSCPKGAL